MKPDDTERAQEVLARWRERLEAGEAVDPEVVIAAHPEIAGTLRELFALLPLLDRVAADAWESHAGRAAAAHAPTSAGQPTDADLPATAAGGADGRRLGDFVLRREIGRGGMGVVYEAEQVSMRRVVALKVLYPSVTHHPKAAARFRREAQAAGRLHHTNIVSVFGMGEDAGTWFYAMERIHGRTLAEVISDLARLHGPNPPAEGDASTPFTTGRTGRSYYERAANGFAALADALEHAHATGVLHRDVKPSNVLLDHDGTLKLTDFGLARLDDGDEQALTLTGDRLGTPAYMSPEQIRSGSAVDARTDVYSLGATLYEMLTLHPPFEGGKPEEIFAAILARDPIAPRRHVPRIPRDLETIVLKALEKDPSRRYRSAADFAQDLRYFGEGAAIRARRMGPVARAVKALRRHRLRAALGVCALALVGVAAAYVVRTARDAAQARAVEYDAILATLSGEGTFGEAGGRVFLRPAELRAVGEKALRDIERAIRLEPDRPDAYVARSGYGWPRSCDEQLEDLRLAAARGLPQREYHLRRADVLRVRRRIGEAEVEERLAMSLPATGPVLMAEIRLFLARGDRREVLRLLNSALESRSSSGQLGMLLTTRAEVRAAGGDLAGAIEDIARASLIGNMTVSTRVTLASHWRRLSQPDVATKMIDEVLEEARHAHEESRWIAICRATHAFHETGWLSRASEEALLQYPASSPLHAYRAHAYHSLEMEEAAQEHVDRSIELNPATPEPWMLGAHVALKTGDLVAAERYIDEAIRMAQKLDLLGAAELAIRAQIQIEKGDLAGGLAELERISGLDGGSHAAFEMLATAYNQADRVQEMLKASEKAIELDARCAFCRATRASAYMQLGRVDDALTEAQHAIDMNPTCWAAWRIKFMTLMKSNRLDDVLRGVEEARRHGLETQGLATWALVSARLGRHEAALEAAERVLQSQPKPEERTLMRALRVELLFGLRRWARTAEVLQEERARGPIRDSWLSYACWSLKATGRLEDALDWVNESLARDPTNATVREWKVIVLSWMRRWDEVIREARASGQTDWVVTGLAATGEWDQALSTQSRAWASREPTDEAVLRRLLLLREAGRGGEAATLARRLLDGAAPSALHPLLLVFAGDIESARRAVAVLPPPTGFQAEFGRAWLCAAMGNTEAAIGWLSTSVRHGMLVARPVHELKSLESDPRFERLAKRLYVR